VLAVKRWFDELFDGYLVEESIWGFRVLIGKRKGLIWDCKEEGEIYGVWGLFEQYL
jgi:hypothetical protein